MRLLPGRVCLSLALQLPMLVPSRFAKPLALNSARLSMIQVVWSSQIWCQGDAVRWWSTLSSSLAVLSALAAIPSFEPARALAVTSLSPGPSYCANFHAAIPTDDLREPFTQRVPPPSLWCILTCRRSNCTAPQATHLLPWLVPRPDWFVFRLTCSPLQ